jgi:hypothetical protein
VAQHRFLGGLVIAAMAIGSVFMWLGVPTLWLLIASQLTESKTPGMGIYGLLLICIPATMFLVGRGLQSLNRLYGEVTHTTPTTTRRITSPWLRSMRGERDSGRERQVIDIVMVWSVLIAVVCMAIWFFFFAGAPF